MNNGAPLIDSALKYIRRGWAPLPIPFRKKGPVVEGWPKLRISAADAPTRFNGSGNIGIILGAASGGLTDLDLDCVEAIELAPNLLPVTCAIFGRASKPGSHWLYRVEGPAPTMKFSDPITGATLLEIRGDGGLQTVFPSSIHSSGESIEWVEDGDPATIEAAALIKFARSLAGLCLVKRYCNGVIGTATLLAALDTVDRRVADRIRQWLALPGATPERASQAGEGAGGPMPEWIRSARSRDLSGRVRRNLGGPEWSPAEEARLRSALDSIPAVSYDVWLHVGMALHSTNWPNSFELWDVWSRTCPEKYNEADQRKTWENFGRPRIGRSITIGTIYHLAAEHGWSDDHAQSKNGGGPNAEASGAPNGAKQSAGADDAQATVAARFRELAALSAIEYDRVRVQEAEKLGIRVGTLDDEVDKYRDKSDDESRAGGALHLPSPAPWPLSVDGAVLLDEIGHEILRFVMISRESAAAIALFAVHAHAYEASLISPRLAIGSPEKRCGKTTLLRVIRHLVPRPLWAANITAAAVFRTIELARPTLLIDEADTFLKENEELRGVLNSGHSKDGQVVRLVGDDHEPRTFSTYCPTVIATIGFLPGTIEDRSIKIVMRRRRRDEPVDRFREDRIEALSVLGRKARRWADDHMEELRGADPDVPGELHDRAADNWRPLLAIADAAAGVWRQMARHVAIALSEVNSTDQESMRTMLLSDIRAAFAKVDRLSSDNIVTHLAGLDERPWSEFSKGRSITKAGLARLLKPFAIFPKTIRFDDKNTAKGYYRADFEDAFARYLPVETVTT
jgi:Protein of unknown function (DUF3631)/Primase C terminal 2 (PriCT-2)/Bifunctional DNA primase/polymerase, N-terminal